MKFTDGLGGALCCDEPIEGVTIALDPQTAEFYGAQYFIGESLQDATRDILKRVLKHPTWLPTNEYKKPNEK